MPSPEARPRRRADAERSITRIVSAARRCLSADPEATIDDIARTAGVGRMTLYGHFPSRAELVEAALVDALRAGERALSAVDLTGDAREAVGRLLESSWSLVAESIALLTAAQNTLSPGRIRELHADPAERFEELLRRGQDEGVFRTDLPLTWLVNAAHHVLHGAAEEVRAGRVTGADAARMVVATVQPMLAAAPVGTRNAPAGAAGAADG
ncbi:TetR/AcrR family transcriptional regulator [Pseudonocardia sp. C8]|uniref:TetR/AcrR family transcriptional regulator n=1 Tax=Pseudonocardia sp. C8 TaxID=2762759 RepID=UPI001642E49F|nr:TetR/AcrR family transcriptional regulator [Pseudonocardia sp. C8]MBC3192473.1 TetR/AcrR family transcriptional regulator [Pseudonocardia sp. C8]